MRTWSVQSKSQPSTWYTITERKDTRNGGTYLFCECPGWKFARGKGQHCKHVSEVIETMGLNLDLHAPPNAPPAGRGRPGASSVDEALQQAARNRVTAGAKLVTEANCFDGVCAGVRGTPRKSHTVADHRAMEEMGLW